MKKEVVAKERKTRQVAVSTLNKSTNESNDIRNMPYMSTSHNLCKIFVYAVQSSNMANH